MPSITEFVASLGPHGGIIVLVGAIIMLVAFIAIVIVGLILVYNRFATYGDHNLETTINEAYKATGKDPAEMKVTKIKKVTGEDKDGRSVYDVTVKFVAGANKDTTAIFRYTFIKTEDANKKTILTVESVAPAPVTA